jgi:hypothetical protein
MNWIAIERNVAKFDALPEDKKAIARQRFTIPYWKRALELHRQGKSDDEAIELAKTKEVMVAGGQ